MRTLIEVVLFFTLGAMLAYISIIEDSRDEYRELRNKCIATLENVDTCRGSRREY